MFDKWNTEADGSGTNYQNSQAMSGINQNLKLYAQWNPITYTVSYNANGGVGTMSSQSFVYDVSKALNTNAFTTL